MIAFKGRVFSVEVETIRLANGRDHEVAIVRHNPSVVLLPMPDDRRIILVRQYRHSIRREMWELPAGSIDRGESPEAAARRECEEEIGQVPHRVERIRGLYPTPGYCDEEMIFFRLSGLEKPTTAAALDEDEDIEVKEFELRDVREMVRRGEIVDMKTIVALTLV
jgi:ADP-ribose pyrophosphatase